jgi:hypothetical protein
VTWGGTQSYTIAPASGYAIRSVDGTSVGTVSSYSFSNVTANHTIQATFSATTASGGSVGTITAAISGTSDDKLYQTERYGNFSYSIPLANGKYNVTLKFAESYFNASGKRVFSVAIGGTTVISSLDIYAKAGQNAAYDIVVPVSVTNGTLKIDFTSQVNNAEVWAILVKGA